MAAETWKEQIPYFSSRDFRVIALDPRSHGQSTKTEAAIPTCSMPLICTPFCKLLRSSIPICRLVFGRRDAARLHLQPESLRPESSSWWMATRHH